MNCRAWSFGLGMWASGFAKDSGGSEFSPRRRGWQ